MEDIELWLYEVEGHLASDDYGKDLTSVQNLQKKQALLEADVAAHQVMTTIIQITDGQTIILGTVLSFTNSHFSIDWLLI